MNIDSAKIVRHCLVLFLATSVLSILLRCLPVDSPAQGFIVFCFPAIFTANHFFMYLNSEDNLKELFFVGTCCTLVSLVSILLNEIWPNLISMPYSGPLSVASVFTVFALLHAFSFRFFGPNDKPG